MSLARPLTRLCPLVAGTVKRLTIPIHVPFAIASESLPEAQIALIELRDADGLKGLGESSPFPSLTGDTISSSVSLSLHLLEEIRGLSTPDAMQKLRRLRPEITRQSITAYVGIEGALWDLYAREENLPLCSLWGDAGLKEVKTDITLPLMPAAEVEKFWNLYRSHGFPFIKVKVSGNVSHDLDLIAALRRLLPAGVQLTLDGNQGFTEDQALKLVTTLFAHDCRPLFFEQPLPAADIAGQRRLQAQLPIPLCADESVQNTADAQRVIEQKLAGMINIKIMKSGIEESLAIIDLARKARLPLMIGGMLESEVAMGISLHMACGTGAIEHFDLDTPFFFKRRVTRASPWHAESARLLLGDGKGHGLSSSAW